MHYSTWWMGKELPLGHCDKDQSVPYYCISMRSFMVVFVLAWMAGIGLGVFGFGVAMLLLAAGTTAAGLNFAKFHHQVVGAAIALMALGYVWGQVGQMERLACLLPEPILVTITERLRIEEGQAQYVAESDEGCRMLVIAGRIPEYDEGDRLVVEGKTQAVADIPKDYAGYAEYLKRQGIGWTIRYPDARLVSASPTWRSTARQTAREQITRVFPEPEAGLVLAMVLAERGGLSDEILEQFRVAGVSHILAISGLHISLLAGVFWMISMSLPVTPLARVGFMLVLLWSYIWLIGAPVSALRAAWFWSLVIAAFRLQWLVSLPTVVLLTAVGLVSAGPSVLQDVGFQLSFSAVVGIGFVLFLARTLPQDSHFGFWKGLFLVSLGATLFTWPLVAYHFGIISPMSLLANLLVVPVVPAVLLLAVATVLISFVVSPLALIGTFSVHVLWHWMDAVTQFVSQLPGAFMENVSIPLWVMAVYYVLLVAAGAYLVRRQGRSWREVWQ